MFWWKLFEFLPGFNFDDFPITYIETVHFKHEREKWRIKPFEYLFHLFN